MQDSQTHQQDLRKELGLRNLVFSQVIAIVGPFWIGTAAKLGPANVSFWLLAIVLFYLPSAAVVIHLNRAHPLEGGLYEWSRLGFNELVGFLVGWNLWLYAVGMMSQVGLQCTALLSYAIGPQAAWMVESKWVVAGVSMGMMLAMIIVNLIGLNVGKRVLEAGGVVMVLTFVALIALPFRNHAMGRPMQHAPFSLAFPVISLFSLNVLGKMGFGALGGFDSMAVFAGETRNARKVIGRSVMIATPLIAAMFVLGTNAVVALVPVDKVDLIGPISQALTLGTQPGDPGAKLIPLVDLGLVYALVASLVIGFGVTTRLPMVAGWDNLLPAWFSRLHPRRKTPTNATLFVGAVSVAMVLASITGAGTQEAFQLLVTAATACFALAYLVMFALPLVGRQKAVLKPPLWLQAASVSGFAMTALFLVLALYPIVDVPRPGLFALKLGGFVVACQAVAAGLFYSYRRKARTQQEPTQKVLAPMEDMAQD